MKLVFYSGGHEEENTLLDQQLLKLVGKEDPLITFIPSCSYESELYFKEFIEQYQRFGVKRFLHFPIDIPYDDILLNEVLKSDVIHLGGGNTFYFIKHLKKTGMLSRLKSFVKEGGILTGLSAGAIIMSPRIDTASFPEFDCDENADNVRSFKAMNLVHFEFFPHYKNSKRYDKELLRYSKQRAIPLYACPDGSGIIVDHENVTFSGKTYCFFQGKKTMINN